MILSNDNFQNQVPNLSRSNKSIFDIDLLMKCWSIWVFEFRIDFVYKFERASTKFWIYIGLSVDLVGIWLLEPAQVWNLPARSGRNHPVASKHICRINLKIDELLNIQVMIRLEKISNLSFLLFPYNVHQTSTSCLFCMLCSSKWVDFN